ncbi:MAG TPA: lysophospholipase [Cytophagales bacterium]|nr:lysophospholipase [Cytophagales bacterium]HAA17895.1 lysophospholipase [Cytophagales bacterium]HAP58182.1 lysophospholipase [Cytophagales bacterium]
MPPASENMKETISYLALGDSYTIGESVDVADRWPVLLGDAISASGYTVDTVQIIATTGWTTDELKAGIEAAEVTGTYNLVSLLIGVNNQYRGVGRGFTLEGYKVEFEALLQQAIGFAGDNKERVFVVSIPDYGVTPFGQAGDPEKIAEELDAYNAAAKAICDQYEVVFYDITPISREAGDDPELVASDRLHPSGKMYRRWVNEVVVPDFILPLE